MAIPSEIDEICLRLFLRLQEARKVFTFSSELRHLQSIKYLGIQDFWV